MRDIRIRNVSVSGLLVAMLAAAPSAQDGQTPAEGSLPGERAEGEPIRFAPPLGVIDRRLVIDGSKNPELIPDETVIRMAMRMWALPPSPDEAAERKFRALASRLQLAPTDYGILRRELQRANPRLAAS